MNKIPLIILTVLCTAALSNATDFECGSGKTYTTLQAAVNAVNVSTDTQNTIRVFSNTAETATPVLTKSQIRIESATNGINPVVAIGNASLSAALSIENATDVVIDGVNFTGGGTNSASNVIDIKNTAVAFGCFVSINNSEIKSGMVGGVNVPYDASHKVYLQINNSILHDCPGPESGCLKFDNLGGVSILNSCLYQSGYANSIYISGGTLTVDKCYIYNTAVPFGHGIQAGARTSLVIVKHSYFYSTRVFNVGITGDAGVSHTFNVFANIFYMPGSNDSGCEIDSNHTWNIYNNTFLMGGTGASCMSWAAVNPAVTSQNNIFYNCARDYATGPGSPDINFTQDHNVHYHGSGTVSDNISLNNRVADSQYSNATADPAFFNTSAPETGLWLKSTSPYVANGIAASSPYNVLLTRNVTWKKTAEDSAAVSTEGVGTEYEITSFPRGAYANKRVFYIASSGADANPGTYNAPFATITFLNSFPQDPGDFFLFAKGDTWRETLTMPNPGASGNVITFRSYGTGSKPVIDGQGTRAYCIYTGNAGAFIVIDGFELRSAAAAGIYIAANSSPTITGCTITGNQAGIVIENTGSGTYQGNTIVGNAAYGISYAGSSLIEAGNIDWGTPTGPLDDSDDRATGGLYNPDGEGDRVSDHINYYPWASAGVSTTTITENTTTTTLPDSTTTVAPTTSTTTEPATSTTILMGSTTTTAFVDSDSDGIPDNEDNCPFKPNGPDLGTCSAGSDKPGVNCTSNADCVIGCSTNGQCITTQDDQDGDGVGDVCDNCPADCNVQQLDADQDGAGDVCDTDPGCDGCSEVQCEEQC